MESSVHINPNFVGKKCTIALGFSKEALLVLFSRTISTNPQNSQVLRFSTQTSSLFTHNTPPNVPNNSFFNTFNRPTSWTDSSFNSHFHCIGHLQIH